MRVGSKTVALGAVAAAALSLAGCQWMGHGSHPGPTARGPSLEDDMFLAAALAHTNSQIELSRMAATKARTPSLVAYANDVAAERVGLDRSLTTAAQADGVGGDTNQVPESGQLAPLKGVAFERAYIAAELQDQQDNLDSFEFEAVNGADPKLRQLAAAEVPRLQQDLARAGAIVRDIPLQPEGDEDSSLPQ